MRKETTVYYISFRYEGHTYYKIGYTDHKDWKDRYSEDIRLRYQMKLIHQFQTENGYAVEGLIKDMFRKEKAFNHFNNPFKNDSLSATEIFSNDVMFDKFRNVKDGFNKIERIITSGKTVEKIKDVAFTIISLPLIPFVIGYVLYKSSK